MISLLGSEGGDLGHLRPKSPRVPSAPPPPNIRASSLLSPAKGPFSVAAASMAGATSAPPPPCVTLSKSPQLPGWYPGPLHPAGRLLFLGSGWGGCGRPRGVDCPAVGRGWGSGAGLRQNKELENAWSTLPELSI